MNILSIGNSYSADAHKWLHALAVAHGIDMQTVNLYIPGCSLETHWENVCNDNPFYALEPNGNPAERKISIADALKLEHWDIITVQQVSYLSGIQESYEPYLSNLVAFVKRHCPWVNIYFHQTWAYEIDSAHRHFDRYNCDQKTMYERVLSVTAKAAESISAPIIPVGPVIQHLREHIPQFDYRGGGLSLCRDGYHLSPDYGRYAAAATWLCTLTNTPVAPHDVNGFDPEILSKIASVVNGICFNGSRTCIS